MVNKTNELNYNKEKSDKYQASYREKSKMIMRMCRKPSREARSSREMSQIVGID